MAATPSVKVVKEFQFKGATHRFSNRYHFNGGVPADDAEWHTLMDAVVAAEHPVYYSEVSIKECIGYVAGSVAAVASKTYNQAGTLADSGHWAPGECVFLIRWSTTARTSKNHPVYLFSYFHGVHTSGDNDPGKDKVAGTQKTAAETYAAAWVTGFSDGAHTLVRAGPNGATGLSPICEEYITHRDFRYTTSV